MRPDEECAHCGRRGQCFGSFNGSPLCHTDEPERDCYRLVTVYWEPLGSRRPARVDEPPPAEPNLTMQIIEDALRAIHAMGGQVTQSDYTATLNGD